MPAATVSPEQVLAFRLDGQGLRERAGTLHEVAVGWALQDSPPGAATLAAHARAAGIAPTALERALEEEKSLLALYNARTATAVVPAEEALAYGAACLPAGEDELRALLANAVEPGGTPPEEAVERTAAVIGEALDGRVLSRDALHAALRAALPQDLLPWCPGC